MKFLKVFLLGILLTLSLESLSANGNKTQQLLKGLRSTDSDVRIATIRKSKEAGSSVDVRVHKALLNVALFDPNGHVRKEAQWALMQTDLNQQHVIERLAGTLSNEKSSVRLSAAKLSASVHPNNPIVHQKVVHVALFDRDDNVKKAAATALERSKPNHETVVNELIQALVQYDSYERVKEVLLIILPDNSRAQMETILNSENIDIEAVRRTLTEIRLNDPRNVESAGSRAGSGADKAASNRETRNEADKPASSKKSSTLSEDSKPESRSSDPPEDRNPESRPSAPQEKASGTKAQKTATTEGGAFNALKEVKNILSGRGPSSSDVYSQLINSALFSDNVYERNRIILALNDVHLEDKDINRLLEFLNGGGRHINDTDRIFDMQRTSIRILGAVRTDNPEIHRRLADLALYEDNHHVRRAAYVVLNDLRLKYPHIHQNNPEIYQQFVDLSANHKEDITLQRNAVRALGGAQPMTSEFYRALVNVVLFSPDIGIRLVAAEALNKNDSSNIEIQIHDTRIVQKLVEAALSGSRSERKAIVGVLKIIWSDHPDEITDRLLGTTRESAGLIKDNVHLSQKVKGILLGATPDIESREKLAAVLENESVDLEAVRGVLREIHPSRSGDLKSAESPETNREVDAVSRREESSTLPEDRESRSLGSQEEASNNTREREEATTEAGVFDVLKEANDIILKENRPTDSMIYIKLAEALLYDSDLNVRRASFRALEITQPDIVAVYMKLVDALNNGKPDIQIRALRTLGALPSTGFHTQNSIVDVALYSTDVSVREEANEALKKIEPSSSEIRQKVVDAALYGTDISIQRNANETLKSMLGISVCGNAF